MEREPRERRSRHGWLGALSIIVLAACGSPSYVSHGLPPASGADATVTVSPRSTGDRQIELAINHLPPPARVDSSASRYAVWILPEARDPVHAGTLIYDEGDRAGSLVTNTPHDGFTLLVTAERHRNPVEPQGTVVVRQAISP